MNSFPFHLPQPRRELLLSPLSLLLRTMPDGITTAMLTALFNHLLKGQHVRSMLPELHGKRIAISIRDTGTRLGFEVCGQRLAHAGSGNPDVTIEGNLQDFWLLASRAEDPDTLFFNRRLALSGSVETGLYVKNLLDSLDYDWDAHLRAVLGKRLGGQAARLLARVTASLSPSHSS